jgi:hypothetical protein
MEFFDTHSICLMLATGSESKLLQFQNRLAYHFSYARIAPADDLQYCIPLTLMRISALPARLSQVQSVVANVLEAFALNYGRPIVVYTDDEWITLREKRSFTSRLACSARFRLYDPDGTLSAGLNRVAVQLRDAGLWTVINSSLVSDIATIVLPDGEKTSSIGGRKIIFQANVWSQPYLKNVVETVQCIGLYKQRECGIDERLSAVQVFKLCDV